MNTQTLHEWNTKLVKGECPICEKVFLHKKAVWQHFAKEHSEKNDEYLEKLIEVNA